MSTSIQVVKIVVIWASQTHKTIHVWLVNTNLQGLIKTNMQLTKKYS